MKVIGFFIGAGLGYYWFSWQGLAAGMCLGLLSGMLLAWLFTFLFQRFLNKPRSLTTRSSQQALLTATFAVLGHVAKADGRVDESEIDMAKALMTTMKLSEEQCGAAKQLFSMGKSAAFQMEPYIESFKQDCANEPNLYEDFLQYLFRAALADGVITRKEQRIIKRAAQLLGVGHGEYQALERRVRIDLGLGDDHVRRFADSRRRTSARTASSTSSTNGASSTTDERDKAASESLSSSISSNQSLAGAYALLGVNAAVSEQELTLAYRRLLSRYHPDKLASQNGCPKSVDEANEKVRAIRAAYEKIRSKRRMK